MLKFATISFYKKQTKMKMKTLAQETRITALFYMNFFSVFLLDYCTNVNRANQRDVQELPARSDNGCCDAIFAQEIKINVFVKKM